MPRHLADVDVQRPHFLPPPVPLSEAVVDGRLYHLEQRLTRLAREQEAARAEAYGLLDQAEAAALLPAIRQRGQHAELLAAWEEASGRHDPGQR